MNMETTNETPSTSAQEAKKQNDSSFNYDEFGKYLENIETQLSHWRILE